MGDHMPGTDAPHAITLIGRLRIERYVWTLDQLVYELPYRTRVSCRREVRQNLLAAARETGTTHALRGIGDVTELAQQYLAAEYGTGPRAHWIAVAWVAALVPLVMMFIDGEEDKMAGAAIRAAAPHATGTFIVPGITMLQSATVYVFSNGQATVSGGAYSPAFYVLALAAIIVAGRLWRIRFRGKPSRPAQGVTA